MAEVATGRGTRPLLLVVVLWVVGLSALTWGVWVDRSARTSGPEATFLAYATAVEKSELDKALSLLMPEARSKTESWVAWQMGNRYRVLEMVLKEDPVLERLTGTADPSTATVVAVMEIEGKGNPTWRAVEEIPARLVGGRWLLAKPPLEGR